MRGQGPVDFGPLDPPKGTPCLEYKTYFFTSGQATVDSILAPNLAFIPGRDLRFCRLHRRSDARHGHGRPDDVLPPHVRNGSEWEKNVKDEARIVSANVQIPSTGYHTLKVWMVDPGITLQKILIDLGGLEAVLPRTSRELQQTVEPVASRIAARDDTLSRTLPYGHLVERANRKPGLNWL